MKGFVLILLLCLAVTGCTQSNSAKTSTPLYKNVGGSCEGCEAIYETSVPFASLSWVDTLPDFHEEGPQLEVSGIVYQRDGKTPAPNVILYVYHTDQQG